MFMMEQSEDGGDSVSMSSEDYADWSRSWSPLSPMEYHKAKCASLLGDAWKQAPHEEHVMHTKLLSRTKLPNGRLSLLVDLGSLINAIGADTEKEFSEKGSKHGHETIYIPRQNRLQVNGVGSDAAICDVEAKLPIAVKFEDHEATKESFLANIATGCGAHLPAVLGLTSMREKDAVLLLRAGKEVMVFPGPGGYKIEWSPGTRLLPMVPAPSGHLVIPCDRFGELPAQEPTEQIAFCSDYTIMTE